MPRFPWAAIGLTATALSVLFAPVAAFADPSPTSVHVVQPGDTLSQIALDAGTDIDTIVALNGLGSADLLSVGASINVPTTAAPAATAAATTAPTAAPTSAPTAAPTSAATAAPSSAANVTSAASSTSTYTVAGGDTMWQIAQRFGTTTDALVQLNHLDDADHVVQGSVLSIPPGSQLRAAASTTNDSSGMTAASVPTPTASAANNASNRSVMVSYTVQPGETLTQIARRFNVAAETIVQATSLSDANKIVVGSVVKVPVAARAHVVSMGETLRDIARTEKVDLGSLIDFNQIGDPSLIRVGQVLLLPAGDAQQASASSSATATPTPAPAAATPTPTAAAATTAATATAATATAATAATATPAVSPTPAPTNTPAATSTPSSASTPGASATATPNPAAAPAVGASLPASLPSEGLAAAALKFLGTPYVWGGATPKGFDCSGFVWYIAKQLNKQISRSMLGQYNAGTHPARADLKPGDLVFFQNTWAPGLSHNGIYLGDNKFVNAADESTGVTISNLTSTYWSAHWFGATRLN